MTELERRRVVERRDLLLDRLDDLAARVPEPAAPQAGEPVEDPLASAVGVIRAIGRHEHPRVGLELAVAGKRHPVRVEPGGVGLELLGILHRLNVPRRTNWPRPFLVLPTHWLFW